MDEEGVVKYVRDGVGRCSDFDLFNPKSPNMRHSQVFFENFELILFKHHGHFRPKLRQTFSKGSLYLRLCELFTVVKPSTPWFSIKETANVEEKLSICMVKRTDLFSSGGNRCCQISESCLRLFYPLLV
jgi:hypothetical protein